MFLYDPLVSDPAGIITHGHTAKTGRQISIYSGDPINRPALLAIFRQIIARNRAGGWRKLMAALKASARNESASASSIGS